MQVVDVPELRFAMVDGALEPECAPGSSLAFQQAIEALYGISFTLKFASKQRSEAPIDYTVMPLEALWWVEDGEFDISQPGNWSWTAMIMQPDHITGSMFEEALDRLRKKRPKPVLDRLRFGVFHEALCMQTVHIGPYSEEPATLARMEEFARENGCILRGKHHEIYLGDPRRSAPEKLRTILRHPIQADR
jgi:hypothetical protein